MTPDPATLLRDFTRTRSEDAFRALVRQHSPVVYSAALRQLGGDRAAAQDVTQEVFSLLVRKASRLENVTLSCWLYRQAVRRAANHVRAETRRKRREQIAVAAMETTAIPAIDQTHLARELDDALLALPAADRDALVLRYFEGQEYRGVGKSLGLSEEAARKRIKRALDRLAIIFKRKGLAISGVSLGTAMESMGASVPASVVSQIAMPAVPVSAGLASLLKPLAAGAAVTSLVAGSALALRTEPAQKHATAITRTSVPPRDARAARTAKNLPENPTLEQIIAEIRRLRSVPGNVLTAMRLKVALGKIGFDRIPEFIALANDELNRAEREGVYYSLLKQWCDKDPDAALTFCLLEKVGDRVDPGTGTNLLNNLFGNWGREDTLASQAWLLRNWNDESLTKNAFEATLRNFLAMKLAIEIFQKDGVDAAFRFVGSVPGVENQAAALKGLVGMGSWSQSLGDVDAGKLLALHEALKNFPDISWRRKLTQALWVGLGEEHAEKVRSLAASMEPPDRFEVSLGLLGAKRLSGTVTPTLSGGFSVTPGPVNDRTEREVAAMEAGLAAGLPRSEVLGRIGETLMKTLNREEFLAWFDAHREEVELDDALTAKARQMAGRDGSTVGQEMEAISWAARISDPGLRRSVCRGAFRRLSAKWPDAAKNYLKVSSAPADLAPDFQAISEEMP